MKEDTTVKRKSKSWLMWSIFAMHGMGWWGVYLFLQTFLEEGKQLTYAGIGVFAVFVISCVLCWREVFFPMVYATKWYLIVEMFLLYLYGLYKQDMQLRLDVLLIGMLCIIGHFWCLYLQGMNEYLNQEGHIERAASEQTFEINTQMVAWILAVLFVCLILAELFQFDTLLTGMGNLVGRAALAVIRFIMSIITFLKKIFAGADSTAEPEPTVTPMLGEPQYYGHENGLAYIIGMAIISVTLITIFVIMIRKAQLKPEQEAGHRPDYHHYGNGNDEVENLESEQLPVLPFLRNNREKIRYRFKKRVTRYYKKNVPEGHTAWQLNHDIQPGEPEEMLDQLTGLYEVARYSRRELTDRDIRGVK